MLIDDIRGRQHQVGLAYRHHPSFGHRVPISHYTSNSGPPTTALDNCCSHPLSVVPCCNDTDSPPLYQTPHLRPLRPLLPSLTDAASPTNFS